VASPTPPPVDGAAAAPIVEQSPDAAPVVVVDAAEELMTAGELEAECRGYRIDRSWSELAQCADKLEALDPRRAAELRTAATEEARSAPRIAGVEAALRDRNLRRARAELEQVWTGSLDYAKLKRRYDAAEAQAVPDLAAQLQAVKDAACDKYGELLAKARTVMPTRVTEEAARRTPCVPMKNCDADALAEKGRKQFGADRAAESLASYVAAYACRPEPVFLQKAFIATCNLHDVTKARSYWKRLSPAQRTQTLINTCARLGVTEAQLSAP